MPCAVGDTLQRAIGMPWCLGCCCGSPILTRNLLRYQYRVQGNDLMEELALPCCAHAIVNWIPLTGICLWGAYALLMAQLGVESQLRPAASGAYLSGAYAPTADQALQAPGEGGGGAGGAGGAGGGPIPVVNAVVSPINIEYHNVESPPSALPPGKSDYSSSTSTPGTTGPLQVAEPIKDRY